MTTHNSITVAVPTMNGASHVRAAIRSILSQTEPATQLLVCDDRSDDETLDIIRSEAGDRVRIAVNSERLGLAGNWNRCVDWCTTPLIAIVHQDDVLHPDHLAVHREAHAEGSPLGLVASGSRVIDAQDRPIPETQIDPGGFGPTNRVFAPKEGFLALAGENRLRCSAVSIRVEAHRATGGFDPRFRYVVDWDFWLRLTETWSMAWRARPTVDVRWHDSSETHRFKKGTLDLEETRALLDRSLAKLGSSDRPHRRLVSAGYRSLARAYLNRAYEASRAGDTNLARASVRVAMFLHPATLLDLLEDPRLAARMTLAIVAPRLAARWLARTV